MHLRVARGNGGRTHLLSRAARGSAELRALLRVRWSLARSRRRPAGKLGQEGGRPASGRPPWHCGDSAVGGRVTVAAVTGRGRSFDLAAECSLGPVQSPAFQLEGRARDPVSAERGRWSPRGGRWPCPWADAGVVTARLPRYRLRGPACASHVPSGALGTVSFGTDAEQPFVSEQTSLDCGMKLVNLAGG